MLDGIREQSTLSRRSLRMKYCGVKPLKYNEYFINTVDTDGPVLWHQGISSHSVEYAPMRFPVFRA